MRTALWVASGALLLRGLAGLLVDGTSDPIWWPTFLVGGILFGGVAALRAPQVNVSDDRVVCESFPAEGDR